MVIVTRRERFSAAHVLRNEHWSDEKNEAVFGKCANQNWHGHNFELFVSVKGEPEKDTGFVIDLKVLANIINKKVISKLDHKPINLDVDFMQGKMASTEVLAIAIWNELKDDISAHDCQLHCIKLKETENNFVEYFG